MQDVRTNRSLEDEVIFKTYGIVGYSGVGDTTTESSEDQQTPTEDGNQNKAI